MNPKDLVGAKKAPLRYVPAALLIEASGPMEDGANKYGPFNWREQPVSLNTYLEAVLRHLLAFADGQDFAEDSGHSHIGHAIASLGIIADAAANGTLLDDRFAKGPAADMLRDRDHSAAKAEAVVYPASEYSEFLPGDVEGAVGFVLSGQLAQAVRDFPAVMPDRTFDTEEWGAGDGEPINVLRMYEGVPYEEEDGCFNYRGKHVHPTVATPATFRSIDRDIRMEEAGRAK